MVTELEREDITGTVGEDARAGVEAVAISTYWIFKF